MSAGSAPTARTSGAAVPSACSRSAASRCSGSTWGLPFAAAFLIATESASWLLRVSLSSMGLFNPPRCLLTSLAGGRLAGAARRCVRLRLAGFARRGGRLRRRRLRGRRLPEGHHGGGADRDEGGGRVYRP